MANQNLKITEKIDAAQLAIDNSLESAAIMERVTKYGYTKERLQEAAALVKAAMDAVEKRMRLANFQVDLTAKVETAKKEAFAVYQDLAQTARTVFKGDKARLKLLGIDGRMPKADGEFIISAYAMFDNAEVPEVQAALTEYGYDAKRLREDRKIIEAFDKLHQKQESAKGDAQQSTRDQDAALKRMFDWHMRYRIIAKRALRGDKELLEKLGILARSVKTAAQRGAGKKASATRAAKKK